MRSLRKYSLISNDNLIVGKSQIQTFSLHRSTQYIGLHFLMEKFHNEGKTISSICKVMKCFYKSKVFAQINTPHIFIIHLESIARKLLELPLEKDVIQRNINSLFLLLGDVYYQWLHNHKLANKYFHTTINIKDLNDKDLINSYTYFADTCLSLNAFNKAIQIAQKTIKYCGKNNLPREIIINNLITIAEAYAQTNNFEKSKKYFEDALQETYKINKDLKGYLLSDIYGHLGSLYSKKYINQQEAHKAKEFIFKSIKILESSKTDDKKQKFSLYEIAKNNMKLGNVYCRLGEYEKAVTYGFKKAILITDHFINNQAHLLLKAQIFQGLGEAFLRHGELIEAEKKFNESIYVLESLIGPIESVPSRILRTEIKIRLKNFTAAYEDCNIILNLGMYAGDNYFKSIFLQTFYHAAFIKYKQNDQKKSIEHFTDFFKGMQEFCKVFLDEKDYKTLEAKRAFLTTPYNSNSAKEDIKKYLKNSVDIFTTIYGASHPFVKDYIMPNYNGAVKSWYKFW